MNRNRKAKRCQGKQYNCQHRYWWVVCVYLFVPVILIIFFDKGVTSIVRDFMAGARIGGGIVLNSRYAVDNVIDPFIESMMIIMGVIVSYFVLRSLQNELLKRRIYFVGVKKIPEIL